MCLVLIKLCPLLADTYSYNATKLALKPCAFMVSLTGPKKGMARCLGCDFFSAADGDGVWVSCYLNKSDDVKPSNMVLAT